MPKKVSIFLSNHSAEFIDAQIRTGRYSSAGDVVQAGLRLLEEHEARVKALRNELIAGEESGPPNAFDSGTFLKTMRAKYSR